MISMSRMSLASSTNNSLDGIAIPQYAGSPMKTENCHLGELGTEQFTLRTMVDGELVRDQPIHDPFIRSTTVTTFSRWRCFLGIFIGLKVKVQISLDGSHAAVSRIMTMNPFDLERETREWEAARPEPMKWVNSGLEQVGELRPHG